MTQRKAIPDRGQTAQPAVSRGALARVSSQTASRPFFDLQSTLGNQAMIQLLDAGIVQAKLRVSKPGDADEIEADRIAEKIVASPGAPTLQRKCACAAGASCSKCEEEEQGVVHRSVATPLLRSSGDLVQRSPADATSGATQAGAASQTTPPAPQEKSHPAQFVVEDDAKNIEPHQMRKSQFIALLRADACVAADAILASVGHTTKSCPYIAKWLGFYEKQSSGHIERTIRKYAPETATARSAHEAISLVVKRVQRATFTWAKTGKIEGLPEEVAREVGGQGGFLGAVQSFASSKVGGAILGFIGGRDKKEDSGASTVSRKARGEAATPAHDAAAVKAELGSGHSLDSSVQSQMSSAFGYDFSGVHVHTDSHAATISSDLQARAFTVGNDVAFASGEYQPGTLVGDALIAHELAHVVQQGGAATASGPMMKGEGEYDALEQDADRSAVGAVASIVGNSNKSSKDVARSVQPRLRSRLGLSRCKSGSSDKAASAKKTVNVNVTFLSGGSTSLAAHLAKANDVYKQADVEVKSGKSVTLDDTKSKAILGDDLILDEYSNPSSSTTEEQALLKENRGTGITMYYVKGMSHGSLGEAFWPATGQPLGFVYASTTSRTWPHELGHVLLDSGDHPSDADNFMAQTSTASGKELMTQEQIDTIRKNIP